MKFENLPWSYRIDDEGSNFVVTGNDGKIILDSCGCCSGTWVDPDITKAMVMAPILIYALEKIADMEDKPDGRDWDGLEEARKIAIQALIMIPQRTEE